MQVDKCADSSEIFSEKWNAISLISNQIFS